ncbi:TNT domain-containing protein [Thermomonospora cellulosilytica]|uniref:TNT domain-containing protein n=1 Tax=Thermomonospora cellulosilytica TaxID=1411118 RepID=A0A7W3MTV8_9ACTN|nr:TNT domain-containing protein [Thermomonospora cellulosilytica]MBA9001804.1 hypothetical protein [Thermomonospora cellulosilytica]
MDGVPGVPQDEHELVAMLHPDNPMLFAHARRWLARSLPEGAARFRVGRAAPGCWCVLRGPDGWQVVGESGTATFGNARDAVVHAMAEIMAAEGMTVNDEILKITGIVRPSRPASRGERVVWELGDVGRGLWERTRDAPRPDRETASRRAHIGLEPLQGHPYGHFVCVPGPPPPRGPFVSTYEVFALLAGKLLPGPLDLDIDGLGDDGSLNLPEGTEVDCYGGTDQVMVYAPGTAYSRRGHSGSPAAHPYHRYRVRRPLRVYPGFWFPTTVQPTLEETRNPPDGEGLGYYLVDSVADLLDSGALAEVAPVGRWRTSWP